MSHMFRGNVFQDRSVPVGPLAVLALQGKDGGQGLRILRPASQRESFRDGGVLEDHLRVN